MGGETRNVSKPARRWLMPALKILLLAGAFIVVYRQVSWNDEVETADGKLLAGTIVDGAEPDAVSLSMRDGRGELHRLGEGEWVRDSKRFGLRTTFGDLTPLWYATGMLLILGMYCLGVARWRLLLEAQGLACTYWRAFRLTFMGFFWNNFMPGMTGGDVAKAVLIARDSPGRRSEAVSTVIVDRVIGLAVLAFISALAILTNLAAFRQQGYVVFAVLGVCLVGFVCTMSRRVRRRLKIDKLLRALPGSGILMKLDAAFLLYRASPRALGWAVGLSAVAHVCNIGSVFVFGRDLDIPADWITYFATVPLIFIIASVPLAPAGWGVREAAFIAAFTAVGVDGAYKSQLVLLSVLVGFSVMFWSLLGGVFLFSGRGEDVVPAEIREAV